MPSVESSAQTLRTLLKVRTLSLGLMICLLWWAEDMDRCAAVLAGWEILFLAAMFSLVFSILSKWKRLSGVLLPLVILFDSVLVGLWVSVSGGPVSYYMPLFLVLLMSAILVLSPRRALWVILGILAVFLSTLYLDLAWDIPLAFDAGKINFTAAAMEGLSLPVREALYWQQALRWSFFFLITIVVGALLMRQVWSREERIRSREKSLEQKRHLIQMGELTGRIAHGVNTPLGLISGNLEMLIAETRKGGKTHRQLQRIDQYVQRAIRTVRDILDYSRQSMSEIKPISLPQVVQAVVAAVQPKLKRAGGKLILDLQKDLPGIMGYPEGLFQVLLNLTENAVDSISPGGIITLSAHFQYRPLRLSLHDRRGEIKVVLRDTGRGIPSDELKRIFEPFYSTKGFGKGTGLGLAIVKRIVDEHQGEIRVESRPGQGSVFTLVFPTDGRGAERRAREGEFIYNDGKPSSEDQAP